MGVGDGRMVGPGPAPFAVVPFVGGENGDGVGMKEVSFAPASTVRPGKRVGVGVEAGGGVGVGDAGGSVGVGMEVALVASQASRLRSNPKPTI